MFDTVADPSLALDGWPGAAFCYRFAGTATQPELAVTLSTRPDGAGPGPAEPPSSAAQRAREQAGRYRLIRAQLDEAGIAVSLLSSVTAELAMPVPGGAPSLSRFARAAELFAEATAAATAPALAGIATLGELLDRYGLSPEQLAVANADRRLNGLLAAGQPLARRLGQAAPDTVPAENSTLAEVAAGLNLPAGRLLAANRGLLLAAEPAVELPGRVTLPGSARIPYSVRVGDTLAVLAQRFATTARELVAGNAEVAGTLLPGIRVEVAVASGSESALAGTDTLAGDSFAAVCARLASQRADVSLDAVADALAQLGAVLSPGPVVSCPLAVLGSDTGDRPLTAIEVQADYGCTAEAFATANAAVLGLLQPGVGLDLDGASTTTTEHDTVHAVLDRLRLDGARPTMDRFLTEHASTPLLRAGGRALVPPSPVTLTVRPGHALEPPALAVPLVVTLRIEGGGAGTARADTEVPPSPDRAAFIDDCLTALPTLRLATDARGGLWTVSFDNGGITVVRVETAAGGVTEPRPFALRPLYPTLVDFTAPIRPVTALGGLGQPVLREHSDVDVEAWARSFLADLDGYLAEPLRARLPDAAREQLVDLRRQLSEALAAGVAPLRSEESEAHADAALANARTALASIARTGLAVAYDASVLAQYRAVVVSPYGTGGRPAAGLLATMRESDQPAVSLSSSRTELDPSHATCTFALTSANPGVLASVASEPRQVFDALELAGSGDGTIPVPLRFVRPLTGDYQVETLAADLPPAELPIPLREQPQPVSAQPMAAAATAVGTAQPTLAEAVQWTAGLSYRHQHAAQDVVRISITDRAPAPATRRDDAALAEALAGYLDASPRLAKLIGTDVEPPDGIDAAALRSTAARSLTTLVAAVTAAWRGHRTGNPVATAAAPTGVRRGAGNLEEGFSGDYRLRAVYWATGQLDRLVVGRTAIAGNWPNIAVATEDGLLPLTPGPVLGNSREYTAAGSLIAGPLTLRMEWPGLRGAPGPGARLILTAERNTELPGDGHINPAFVLTARPVQVAVPSPSLRWDEEMPLTGSDLAQALQHAFGVLAAGQPDRRASVGVSYVELVGGLPSVSPVLLGDLVLGAEKAIGLAAAMRDWQRRVRPATAGAVWQLRLAVLSSYDGQPPLVTFERLVFPATAD
jgi:hypothetical protein